MSHFTPDFTLDAGPAGCGELVMLIFQQMRRMSPGQTLAVIAHDEAADVDIPAWSRTTGHPIIQSQTDGMPKRFVIQKRL